MKESYKGVGFALIVGLVGFFLSFAIFGCGGGSFYRPSAALNVSNDASSYHNMYHIWVTERSGGSYSAEWEALGDPDNPDGIPPGRSHVFEGLNPSSLYMVTVDFEPCGHVYSWDNVVVGGDGSYQTFHVIDPN